MNCFDSTARLLAERRAAWAAAFTYDAAAEQAEDDAAGTARQAGAEDEDECHCGARFLGSDHCPCCYCERYEATCDYRATAAELEEQRERLYGSATCACGMWPFAEYGSRCPSCP